MIKSLFLFRFAVISLPVALAACASLPSGGTEVVASATQSPGLIAPVEEATTAYTSRADGPYTLPAVPLEKLPEALRRQTVALQTNEAPGTIVIHPGQKFLYFVTGKDTAIRYGISVGKAGFEWAGVANVVGTKNWPTWTPPPEMIERKPELAKWEKGQPGGPTNPLGARAIYLETNGRDYGYRIHGTPDWWSIGKNASSGCIRMIHQDVIDLNQRIQPGARVVVLNADGSYPDKLKLPPPQKAKPKAVKKTAPVLASAPVTAAPAPASAVETTVVPAAITAPTTPGAALATPSAPSVAPAAAGAAPTVPSGPPAVQSIAPAAPVLIPPGTSATRVAPRG